MNKAFKKYFNPYRNGKTLQWALDNYEEFQDRVLEYETMGREEMILDTLPDHITYENTPDNKALQWADRNYYELEFDLDYCQCYFEVGKVGSWSNCDGKRGIYVMSIGMNEEIEVQAENGELAYMYIGPNYFRVLARVA